jgi:hypothetical protein
MMRPLDLVAYIAAILVALGVAWLGYQSYIAWASAPPFYESFRFRMTVEVEVDGQIKSGSSVIDVAITRGGYTSNGKYGDNHTITGEAVYVDLGNGRNVFAVLWFPYSDGGSHSVEWAVARALYKSGIPGLTKTSGRDVNGSDVRAIVGKRGSASLSFETMPQLLSFDNMAAANTLRILNPSDDSFARVFGPGVSFRSVQIELVEPGRWPNQYKTGEPLTRNLDDLLPWLDGVDGINAFSRALRADPAFANWNYELPDQLSFQSGKHIAGMKP